LQAIPYWLQPGSQQIVAAAEKKAISGKFKVVANEES
jgi:hypothetical protein